MKQTNQDNIVQLSPDKKVKFDSIDAAFEALRAGRFVVMAYDEGRENEGTLIGAASVMSPGAVNFMARAACGLICVTLTDERARDLQLFPMVDSTGDPNQTAFTISVDAGPEFGITSGLSAADRATTIQRLIAPNASAADFRRPGHIFPLVAQQGGVLRRVGYTEASLDLVRLADLPPMGVICEVLNDDGAMATRDELAAFAKQHDLPFIHMAQLIQYRLQRERFIDRRVATPIDTRFGPLIAIGYQDELNGTEHLALVKGDLAQLAEQPPLVCFYNENILSDVLSPRSARESRELDAAMEMIEDAESGVVVYLRNANGAPQGLLGSLQRYGRQDDPLYIQPSKTDQRDYGVGAQILNDLGITQFRLITRQAKKMTGLRGYGLEIVDTLHLPKDQTAQADRPWVNAAAEAPTKKPAESAAPKKPRAQQDLLPISPYAPPAPKLDKAVEKKSAAKETDQDAEPRIMKMGGQIVSNQALFEG